jgi:hypothetical protein
VDRVLAPYSEAENIRGALLAHRDEAREVLAAFVSTMRFEPVGQGRDRRYEFHGEGDYGPLLGATFARPRVPEGYYPLGATFIVEGRAAA